MYEIKEDPDEMKSPNCSMSAAEEEGAEGLLFPVVVKCETQFMVPDIKQEPEEHYFGGNDHLPQLVKVEPEIESMELIEDSPTDEAVLIKGRKLENIGEFEGSENVNINDMYKIKAEADGESDGWSQSLAVSVEDENDPSPESSSSIVKCEPRVMGWAIYVKEEIAAAAEPEDLICSFDQMDNDNDQSLDIIRRVSEFPKRHIDADMPTFRCELCSKVFSVKGSLNQHVLTHAEKRAFECDICKKCFPQKVALNRHVVSHLEEQMFQCQYCYKYFSQKNYLNTHIDAHGISSSFQCEFCNNSYAQKRSLTRHIRSAHAVSHPFHCLVCNKSFATRGKLNNHTRLRSYKCETCGKSFCHKGNLISHMVTHTNYHPF